MPKNGLSLEYILTAGKLWGKQISGPVLAGLSLLFGFLAAHYASNAEVGTKLVRYSAWATGTISILFVFYAQYQAWTTERGKYEEKARTLANIDNGRPRLKLKEPDAFYSEPITQTFTGITPAGRNVLKTRLDTFFKVRFINDPELCVPSSKASGVTATIEYWRCSDTRHVLTLDGRWSESTQPSALSPLESKFPLLSAEFYQGQQRSLDIAFCDGETGKYYAWNNDNYNALNEFFVYPKHLLEGKRFNVKIRLRGDWIDKRVSVTFSAKDKGFAIESYQEE